MASSSLYPFATFWVSGKYDLLTAVTLWRLAPLLLPLLCSRWAYFIIPWMYILRWRYSRTPRVMLDRGCDIISSLPKLHNSKAGCSRRWGSYESIGSCDVKTYLKRGLPSFHVKLPFVSIINYIFLSEHFSLAAAVFSYQNSALFATSVHTVAIELSHCLRWPVWTSSLLPGREWTRLCHRDKT